MRSLFANPTLRLQDFGGIRDSGVFRFKKGTSTNFHYKNLSGGEKAAFDLLLDVFVKRSEYGDAVYCIDEPEAHVATALHGPLLETLLDILPEKSQLWIATHSIGFVRKAYDVMRNYGTAVFLDFSNRNFERRVEMHPQIPDRIFWRDVYRVALDDLAELIAPANLVICEGKKGAPERSFDSYCYNQLFADTHPDTLFIPNGGSNEVEQSENLVAVLRSVLVASRVWKVIDRDDMTEIARKVLILEKGLAFSAAERLKITSYDQDCSHDIPSTRSIKWTSQTDLLKLLTELHFRQRPCGG